MNIDAEKISQAVAEAEKKTMGEIVPMIVSASDAYPGAQWRFAALFMLLGEFLLVECLPGVSVTWFILSLPLLLTAGFLIGSIHGIRRIFSLDKELDEEVQQRALFEFYHHKLARTQNRTGVLIFVSRLEHRVVVLADEGINQKVQSGTWNEIVNKLIPRIRRGEFTEGLIAAVHACGMILAQHFPASGENPNELPNHLIVKD